VTDRPGALRLVTLGERPDLRDPLGDHNGAWTLADGLPFDAWIRLHARLGGGASPDLHRRA
jgi:hypothetical protein